VWIIRKTDRLADMEKQNDYYLNQLKELILSSIDPTKYAVFVFGSRARGKTGKATDVDIGILGHEPFTLDQLAALHSLIEESIVPYKVDIVDFFSAEETFKSIALTDIEIWNKPNTIELNVKT
jgi:predicted nucleotidyltransferase